MIHNCSTLRLYSSRKNLPLFDTSTFHKKTKTGRIIVFTKFLVFSYMLYYCMELLYMTIVEKRASFLDAYLLDIFLI